jgi:FixJ family two-component response regulator
MSAAEKPKANILIIDDEQIVHESVRRILESENYIVDGAFRVAEALRLLSERSYDLVLTDLMMPDESGMKAVEAVARDHPYCGVVMFTGFATVESAVESMKLGALDYLPKPFTPEELVETVGKALAKVVKARKDAEISQTYSEAEKAIRSSLDLKEILNLICGSVVRLLQMRASALLMYNKREGTLELVASVGVIPEQFDKGAQGPAAKAAEVMQGAEPVTVAASGFDSYLNNPDAARKEGIVSVISMPLKVKNAALGIVRLYSADKQSLNADETEILVKFAEQAARALENAMAYEQVRRDVEGLKKSFPGTAPK